MRIGIFSDVHGNLEALNAVLAQFEIESVDSFFCLGDEVGYGPNPNECVEKISALPNLRIVGGNHDYAALGMKSTARFQSSASKTIAWTKKQLTPVHKNFLAKLPKRIESSLYTLVHGSPRDPLDERVVTSRQYAENLEYFSSAVCFVGHTHIPNIFYTDDTQTVQHRPLADGEIFKLNAQSKTMVNCGSVGQPRDGDTRAACAIFDDEKLEIKMLRCSYDLPSVQEKMKQAGFSEFIIDRLTFGR